MAKKQRITYADIANSKVGLANKSRIADLWPTNAGKKKNNKYNNEPVIVDGIRFDSTGEGTRYSFLKRKERAGKIKDLRLQVPYELAPKTTNKAGKTIRSLKYVADFVYFNNITGEEVVEDFKGRRTRSFIDKSKQMISIHGIEIYETTTKHLKEYIL